MTLIRKKPDAMQDESNGQDNKQKQTSVEKLKYEGSHVSNL